MRFDIFLTFNDIGFDDGLTVEDLVHCTHFRYVLDPNIVKLNLVFGRTTSGGIYIKNGMVIIPSWYNLKKYEI
jgi:hypothetical protein